MRNIQLMTAMLMAGVVFTGGAWAADAAPAAVKVAPVAVETEKSEVKEAALSDTDGRVLLQKNNCLACHAMDKKVVGPAFKDVAAKYRDQADAEAKLVTKVTKGGKGAWGSMAMPAQSAKQDDIKAMVRFVLSLK